MLNLNGHLTHFHNPKADAKLPYDAQKQAVISVERGHSIAQDVQCWPGYAVTPLHSLSALAETVNLSRIWYKDESMRFDLKSFKALGGAYAVACQLQKVIQARKGETPAMTDLLSGAYNDILSDVVVSCATDGNHGRSVAWGARLFGCQCVIYIHRDVSKGREEAMAELGATVVRIEGNYDDSVKIADREAKAHQRIIVSDTSYEGYTEIPKDVALGYTVMLAELVEQLQGEIPTHVFVQGGVGGLASAVCGYFWDLWGEKRPRCIIVEPEQANCLQQSAQAGHPVVVKGALETLMAGLACGEVSIVAWQILATGADDFMTLSEDAVPQTMRLLTQAEHGSLEAGESAVPGLAAALLSAQDATLRETLNLTADSTVLVIGTEGATDPELYHSLINNA